MDLLTGINDHGRRLDRILRKALPGCPLPLIHKLLRKGLILVNGKPASAQTRVAKGSKISIPRLTAKKIAKKTVFPAQKQVRQKPIPQEPMPPQKPEITQNINDNQNPMPPLREGKLKTRSNLSVRFYHPPDVLWKSCGLIAFNKPAGLAVHGQASMERMVQAYLVNKLPPSLSFKPGPLHRLDKPSSGIVVFSTSLEGANLFSSLMKEHKIKKTYLAIVEGSVKNKYFWTEYLARDKEKKKTFIVSSDDASGADKKNSKIAITMVMPKAYAKINGRPYTLIEAEIETGRTHQIRAQSSFHGHPLAGDRKYGGHFFEGGLFLHSYKLEFLDHKIEAPLPKEFQKLADTVFNFKKLL